MPAHLSTGSTQPPKVDGLLRLYSMEYCPYAHRARLVLKAKGVPHDIVNINLTKKPDWYLKIHPEGKVPALDTGDKIVIESLDIADFLDEKYPQNPLYPTDAKARQKDKDLIQKIAPLTGAFYNFLGSSGKTPAECLQEFKPHLDVFEKELAERGTVFFGGDKPKMVDFMLWPWGERAGVVAIKLGEKLPLEKDQFALLRRWKDAMRKQPEADETYNSPAKYWKVIQFKLTNATPDFDNI